MPTFQKILRFYLSSGLLLLFFALASALFADDGREMSFERSDDGTVAIRIDGKLFTRFMPNVDGTPILWPILSEAGSLMSRSLPMIERTDPANEPDSELKNIYRNGQIGVIAERNDHPHHRSLWFTHGDVNGVDFWALDKGTSIRTEEILRLEKTDDNRVLLATRDRWTDDKKGVDLAEDVRTMTFGTLPATSIRFIDYDIELTALVDSLTFGDTKEGTFGYRTPGTMDVDARQRDPKWGGKIVNAEGLADGEAWAKRSGWVDYSGPVPKRLTDEELDRLGAATAENLPLTEGGVTIMNHPAGFRAPSWYHVRTYGLFAVNPFGIHDFEPDSGVSGKETLSKGEKLVFRYRVLIYDGRLSPEEIARFYDDYCR